MKYKVDISACLSIGTVSSHVATLLTNKAGPISPSHWIKVVCRGTDDSFCVINCPSLVGNHVGS